MKQRAFYLYLTAICFFTLSNNCFSAARKQKTPQKNCEFIFSKATGKDVPKKLNAVIEERFTDPNDLLLELNMNRLATLLPEISPAFKKWLNSNHWRKALREGQPIPEMPPPKKDRKDPRAQIKKALEAIRNSKTVSPENYRAHTADALDKDFRTDAEISISVIQSFIVDSKVKNNTWVSKPAKERLATERKERPKLLRAIQRGKPMDELIAIYAELTGFEKKKKRALDIADKMARKENMVITTRRVETPAQLKKNPDFHTNFSRSGESIIRPYQDETQAFAHDLLPGLFPQNTEHRSVYELRDFYPKYGVIDFISAPKGITVHEGYRNTSALDADFLMLRPYRIKWESIQGRALYSLGDTGSDYFSRTDVQMKDFLYLSSRDEGAPINEGVITSNLFRPLGDLSMIHTHVARQIMENGDTVEMPHNSEAGIEVMVFGNLNYNRDIEK